jgi:oxygen-independent coproporphyrinogen-3 oxidase
MQDAPRRVNAPAGLYIHFPFCSARCSYCDFAVVVGRDSALEAYLAALELEIEHHQAGLPSAADTLYLGGGTPSRLEAEHVDRVIRAVRKRFDLAADAEITLEGNPESLTRGHLSGYRDAGVNRISVGVQSLDDRVLRRVGRAHDAEQAIAAVARVRESGIPEVNVDLIAGLPGEDLARWGATVEAAAQLGPDHISVYLLETDKETPLARALRSGRTLAADEDSLARAYLCTVERLEALGLPAYEISNFARDGHRSRHNLKYWTDGEYGGFGLGAHAYCGGARRANRRDLDGYLAQAGRGDDPVEWVDPWDPLRRAAEALVMGLRLAEGADLEAIGARYDTDLGKMHRAAWERAEAAGLIAWSGMRVALTPPGRLRSNELFAELI